jgi:hypothetical protein
MCDNLGWSIITSALNTIVNSNETVRVVIQLNAYWVNIHCWPCRLSEIITDRNLYNDQAVETMVFVFLFVHSIVHRIVKTYEREHNLNSMAKDNWRQQ